MAFSKYELNGQIFWKVYLNIRSKKDARIRVQKKVKGLKSEKEAANLEKKLIQELTKELVKQESKGATWEEVVNKWFLEQKLHPTRKLTASTLLDYEAMLKNYTAPWLKRVASEISRGDAREIFNDPDCDERSLKFRKKLKYTINIVYTWGLEERLIVGPHQSPVFGLEIRPDNSEKRPEILTSEQIKELLRKAKQQSHPWYPIWTGAVLTGCRSGELHQLRKEDLEIISQEAAIQEDAKPFHLRRYGCLRVRHSWSVRFKQTGPTKAGYWRTVPVSSEFYWFLIRDLLVETRKPKDHLFPRFWEWDKGEQARILRGFCLANGLPQIKFHTLRACFATQLISSGVPATVVMKICGWKDLKTMQYYIRLAGVDEAGATEILRFIPTEEAVMEKVVSLYDWKKPV